MPRPSSTALDDGGEVVVEQDEVGHFAADVRAALTHGHADIGTLQRGRIVDPVAGHRHDLTLRLQRFDEQQLLLRPHAREHIHLASARRAECGASILVEVLPGEHPHARDADLMRNGQCRRGMVTGDHDHADTGVQRCPDGLRHLRPRRIPEQREAQQRQVVFGFAGRARDRQDAKSLFARTPRLSLSRTRDPPRSGRTARAEPPGLP